MTTVSTKISEELDVRIETLAKQLDRKKGYIIRKAIEQYLEDQEDYLIAVARLAKKDKRIPLDQLEIELDLED